MKVFDSVKQIFSQLNLTLHQNYLHTLDSYYDYAKINANSTEYCVDQIVKTFSEFES